ncbi:HNH endonuclease [Nonomuraea sp. NPDC004186]
MRRKFSQDASQAGTLVIAVTPLPPDLGCMISTVAESGAGVACNNGRPKLTQDQDRRLFAESAGTCLLCSARLFVDIADSSRSISIAERAHVVAHSDSGPRADQTVSDEERSDPANIVLLCPTCHTQVDKVPDSFPVEVLLSRKRSRAAAVALVGGTPVFETRSDARSAVKAILERNHLIFSNYGPDVNDGSISSVEEAERWSRHVLEDIVPGNELVVAIVRVNERLTTDRDRGTAELLRLHTRDLAEKHRGQAVTAPARRFPAAAENLFTEDEYAQS